MSIAFDYQSLSILRSLLSRDRRERSSLNTQSLNTQSCHLPLAGQLKIKNRLGHKHGREDVRDQADHQRYSEPLHGSGTKDKQKRTRYHGSDVRVDNG